MAEKMEEIRGAIDNIRAEVEDNLGAAQDATKQLANDLVTTVRQNPVTSLAVAVAVGFTLGLLSRRGH